MKKSLTLLFLTIFLSNIYSQGCYNLNLQNPSGTFTTLSNGWSLVGNCMVGGNYAVFDVQCGSSYEWSLCSNYGGMTAWDAELTLLDQSNNIIGYNDNSGMSGCSTAPTINWTATSTGQVKVLLTESGCLVTQSGCNRMVWRMSAGSGNSINAPPVTAQPDPTNPTAGILVSWSQVSAATLYKVIDCSDNSVVGTTQSTQYSVTGLQSGLSYSYKVEVVVGNCGGVISQCATSTTQAAAAPPVTNFISSKTTVIEGETITFTDQSTNAPTSYGWSFQGGNPSTSNLQNPSVTYNTAGVYSVSLTTQNIYGSDTKTDNGYITVLQQGTTSIYVGGLVIYADNITPSGNMRTATGNVRIGLPSCNSFVHFEDDLYIEMGTNEITANTRVFFVGNTGDTTGLYNGPFTYEITGAMLTDINNPINGLFRLSKLPVQISNMELLCDGILIEGRLSLPAEVSNWTSNPAFASTVVNANLSALKITQTNGIQFAGQLNVNNVKISNKLKLNYLNLSLNTITDVFSGSTKLTTPIIGIGGSARISQGKLDQIGLSVSPITPIPLGTSGLAISTGYGSIQYLSTPPPLEMTLGCHVVPATPMSFESLGYLDLSCTYQLGTYFGANGKISIFDHYLANVGFKVWSNKMKVNGSVGFKGLIYGYGTFSIQKPPTTPIEMYGTFGAHLMMPPQSTVDSLPAYIRYPLIYAFPYNTPIATCDNYVNTDYLTGVAEVNAQTLGFSIPKIFYRMDYAGSGVNFTWGINYQIMPATARYELGINRSQLKVSEFELAASSKSILIEKYGYSDWKLRLPNGDSITTSTNNITTFTQGDYTVIHIENGDLGEYEFVSEDDSVNILRANMPPSIEIKYFDGTQVIWEDYDIDDDATIILGLDNDMKDVDGIWVADNLSEDNLDGIVLNTNVPTGTYYLYAIIKDSLGQQHFDYYPTPVTLIQDGAPNAPTGLNYQTTDSTLTFFVDSSTSDQYILYYSTKGEVDHSSENILFGSDSLFEFVNFNPGVEYWFGMTRLDSNHIESEMSNIVHFTWTSATINNIPEINEFLNIRTGQSGILTYPINYTDHDQDTVCFEIISGPGSFIGNEYVIDTDTLSGDYFVKYTYSDGTYLDSSHFELQVLTDDIAEVRIDVDKTYIKDGEDLLVRIYDPFVSNVEFTVDGNIYTAEYEGEGWFKKNITPTVVVNSEIKVEYETKSEIVKCYALAANFHTDTIVYCSLDEVEFINESIGDNIKYEWNFGDGQKSLEKNPKHIYEVDGFYDKLYDIMLTVTDDESNKAYHFRTVTVKGSTSYECFNMSYLDFYAKEDGTLVFSNDYENLKLEVYSTDGKLVISKMINTKNREYRLDKKDISGGIYSISVTNNSESKSIKILL